MMDYNDMRLLADEVLRQMRAASSQVHMSTLDVAPGTERHFSEVYTDEELVSKSDTSFRTGIRGSRETRTFVYEGKMPWLVEHAIERAKKEDSVLWTVAKNEVGHTSVLKQVATWPYYEEAIRIYSNRQQSNN